MCVFRLRPRVESAKGVMYVHAFFLLRQKIQIYFPYIFFNSALDVNVMRFTAFLEKLLIPIMCKIPFDFRFQSFYIQLVTE